VKIHGRRIQVSAQVRKLDSMSAHADRGEILRWLGTMPRREGRLCLVHGEPGPMDALRTLVADRLKWDAHMPVYAERIAI
jgi:metallo-beta-lactamase family protein